MIIRSNRRLDYGSISHFSDPMLKAPIAFRQRKEQEKNPSTYTHPQPMDNYLETRTQFQVISSSLHMLIIYLLDSTDIANTTQVWRNWSRWEVCFVNPVLAQYRKLIDLINERCIEKEWRTFSLLLETLLFPWKRTQSFFESSGVAPTKIVLFLALLKTGYFC